MKFTGDFGNSHSAQCRLAVAEQDILRTLEQDWCTITLRDTPVRFDPAQMDAALPYAFMLERTAPCAIRTRVAGQKLHDMLRMDPRGMSFGSFFTEEARDVAIRLAETAFTTPAIVGIPLTAARGLGRRPLRAKVLLLPLRDVEGRNSRMMGALVVSGPIGHRGLRFDIAKDEPVRCDEQQVRMVERRSFRAKPLPPTREQIAANPGLRLVVDNT